MEDSEAVPKTRSATMGAAERERIGDVADAMDTLGTIVPWMALWITRATRLELRGHAVA